MIERNYSPSLEGLRGVAALLVIVNHLRGATPPILGPNLDPAYARCGTFGVAIFFCLTGYLFWQRTALSDRTIDWVRFYGNRALRIVPAFMLSGVLVIVVAGFISGWSLHDQTLTVLQQTIGQLSFGFTRTDELNGVSVTRFNAVAWTLTYEWKFYLALPLLMAVRRARYGAAIGATLAVVFILVCAPIWKLMLFFGTGMLAAEFLTHQRRASILGSVALAILCAVWVFVPAQLIAPAVATSTDSMWAGDIAEGAWFWVVGSLAFFAVVATSPAILRLKPIVFVGTISYSLYLLHLFAIQGTLHSIIPFRELSTWGPKMFLAWSVLAVACAIAIATISFYAVEKPFLSRKRPERERAATLLADPASQAPSSSDRRDSRQRESASIA